MQLLMYSACRSRHYSKFPVHPGIHVLRVFSFSFLIHLKFLVLSAGCCLLFAIASTFGFPLFAPVMYTALEFGKGDTILAVVAIVIDCSAPWIFWHYGEQIRNSSRYERR